MYYRNKPKHADKDHHMVKENFTIGSTCKFPMWLLIVIIVLILIAGGLLVHQLMNKKSSPISSAYTSQPVMAQGYSPQRFGYGFI